eukprot:8691176-Prorocentrum_lima.AAC.1
MASPGRQPTQDATNAAASTLWDFLAVWPLDAQAQSARWMEDRAHWDATHSCRHDQWELAVTL